MSYDVSYNAAKARRHHFLLAELMSLCTTTPETRSQHGRPVEFPLPTLFVLLGLKFDTGLGHRDFIATLTFNTVLLQQLGLDRSPHFTLLQKTVKRWDTQLLHQLYQLLASKRPPPKTLAVDSSGFSHSSGGAWMTFWFKRTRKRRFQALHNVVDTDTLMITAARVSARPSGDARHLGPLVRKVDCTRLETVYEDNAFISRENVQCIHDLGVYLAIEPKRRLKSRSRGYRDTRS